MTIDRAALRVLAERMQAWEDDVAVHDDGCVKCHESTIRAPDLEPSPLCHLCAQDVASDLPLLVSGIDAKDRRIAELERPRLCPVCGACETHDVSKRIDALESALTEAINWIADRSSPESILVDRMRKLIHSEET